jgi:hypothetical protein
MGSPSEWGRSLGCIWESYLMEIDSGTGASFELKPSPRGWRRFGVGSIGALLLMVGLSMATAPAAMAATSGTVNTFHLSGGLRGTLALKPSVGCGDAGYLNDLTGHVAGLKGVKSWTIAINTDKPGTYKATDSLSSKAHVTLAPYPLNAIKYTLTNVGGTLTVKGTDASSGSLNLKLANVTNKIKAKLVGGWSCPPAASS